MRTSLLLGASLCVPFLAVCLHGQVSIGTVNGIARDSQGKSISGAGRDLSESDAQRHNSGDAK
jgi:hypothetical protein